MKRSYFMGEISVPTVSLRN